MPVRWRPYRLALYVALSSYYHRNHLPLLRSRAAKRSIAMDTWKIALLGGLSATRGEQVITHFRTQKTATLLAYLAFHLYQNHPRERLIELLWPEVETEVGRSR